MADPEHIPTLAELVKAKMDKDEAAKPRVRRPSGGPHGFLWFFGLVTLIIISVFVSAAAIVLANWFWYKSGRL